MNVQWIKLKLDIFNDEKMKIIQAMPQGDTLLVIWLNLLVIAGKCNAEGLLLITDTLEYTPEMLASVMGRDLMIVNMALSTFERLGMIDYTDEGAICISNFAKHQNIEGLEKIKEKKEQNRIRKQRQREREKNAIECKEESSNYEVSQSSDSSSDDMSRVTLRDKSVTVTQCHATDIDIEIEKEYINNNMSDTEVSDSDEVAKDGKENIDYIRVQNSFNNICKDLPRTRTLSPARKRGIKAAINYIKKNKLQVPEQDNSNPYEVIDYIFKLVDDSDFLSGRTAVWQNCSFDWIMNTTNLTKIYDLNYANKPKTTQSPPQRNNQFNNFTQRNYGADYYNDLERRLLGK